MLRGLAWDDLFTGAISFTELAGKGSSVAIESAAGELPPAGLLPPIGAQEVWAAGVTYLRSRTARMEESAAAGGADFYDKVYNAHRPGAVFQSDAASCGGARPADVVAGRFPLECAGTGADAGV